MNPSYSQNGLKFYPASSFLLGLLLIGGSPFAHGQTAKTTPPTAGSSDGKTNTVDVTVTAEHTAAEKTGTATVVTAETLKRRGVADMGAVVRYEPLVNAPKAATGSGNVWDGSGYTGYNIRGMEGNRVSLDIDGVPLPDAAPKPDGAILNSFGVGRDYLEIENFQAIEVGSGTTSSTRGTPGLGGGVAYITKSPADYLGRSDRPYYLGYKIGYASVDESLAHTFTGAAEHGALQALVVYTLREGEETDTKGSTKPNVIDWDSAAVLTKLVWKNANGHHLDFTLDYFKREMDITVTNKASTSYVGGVLQDSLAERFTLSATHKFIPSVALPLFDSVSTKIYFQDAVTDDTTAAPNYVTGGIAYRRNLRTKFNNDSIGLNADAIKRIGTGQRLNYGISASQTETSRPWSEVRTRLSDSVITQQGTKDRMPAMKTTKLATYVNDEINFAVADHRVTVTPGIRFESQKSKPEDLSRYVLGVPAVAKEIKADTESYIAPSLAFNLSLTAKLDAYATYKRGARIPTPVEKTGTYDSFSYTGSAAGYAVLGNPDLKKETSDSFEVGLRGQPFSGVTFHATAFYTGYKNYIEYATQPYDPANYPTISFGLFRPENLGEAEIYGVEASAKFDLGVVNSTLAGFSAQLALGRANSSAKNNETGVKSPLPSVGPFKGSLTLAYDAPSKRFGLSLIGSQIGAKQASPDLFTGGTAARFAVPSATLVDFAGYVRINKHISLYAGINNLTDEKYWDYYSARGLSASTTPANLAEIERYVQPGLNAFVSLSLGF